MWVVMSPVNDPVMRALWKIAAAPSNSGGMIFKPEIGAEDRFLCYLDTIDLHHGPQSTETPYMVLEVIGLPLTANVRQALLDYGFRDFSETESGFIGTCSAEEASRDRPG